MFFVWLTHQISYIHSLTARKCHSGLLYYHPQLWSSIKSKVMMQKSSKSKVKYDCWRSQESKTASFTGLYINKQANVLIVLARSKQWHRPEWGSQVPSPKEKTTCISQIFCDSCQEQTRWFVFNWDTLFTDWLL